MSNRLNTMAGYFSVLKKMSHKIRPRKTSNDPFIMSALPARFQSNRVAQ